MQRMQRVLTRILNPTEKQLRAYKCLIPSTDCKPKHKHVLSDAVLWLTTEPAESIRTLTQKSKFMLEIRTKLPHKRFNHHTDVILIFRASLVHITHLQFLEFKVVIAQWPLEHRFTEKHVDFESNKKSTQYTAHPKNTLIFNQTFSL